MQNSAFTKFARAVRLLSCLAICCSSLLLVTSAGAIPATHTVTFVENDNSSDSTATFQYATQPSDLTLFANLNPTFSDPGYTFAHWNTAANGSGVSYADGANYPFDNDIELFAQWTTVANDTAMFSANGGTGTVTPISAPADTSITLPSAAGITDIGYTFSGWNTEADGTGSTFAAGTSIILTTSVSFYAVWTPNQYTVSFNPDGGTVSPASAVFTVGGSPVSLPTPAESGETFSGWFTSASAGSLVGQAGATLTPTQSEVLYAQWNGSSSTTVIVTFASNGGTGTVTALNGAVGSAFVLPDAAGFTNPGYTVTSWNTSATGAGTTYALGQSVNLSISTTLYAQWTLDSSLTTVVTITLDEVGGSTVLLSGNEGQPMMLPSASGLSNPGYTLTSWNTASNGSGASYTPGVNITLTTSMTLYAQWTPVGSVQLSFSVNGGSGSLATVSGASGATVTLPGLGSAVRAGYVLTSWNTSANGSGTTYALGQSFMLNTSMTLYAQWKAHVTSILYGAVGDFGRDSMTLSAGMKGQINRLASVIKKDKYDKVTLFGYSAASGLTSIDLSLSRGRARNVAAYLRLRLKKLKVKGVLIRTAGEGSIGKNTSALYSRVEVFVV